MSHTPGPWLAKPERGEIILNGSNCYAIDEIYSPLAGHNPADITLMAAAPELLDAVEQLLIYLGDWEDMDNDTCRLALTAVAKAKGETK